MSLQDVAVRRSPIHQGSNESPDIRDHHPAQDQRHARETENQLAEATGEALRRAAIVVQLERKRGGNSRRLGYTQLDYGRLFQRDQWTMFAIARELGCTVEDLLPPPEAKAESRVVWSDLCEAAEHLLGAVNTMPEPRRTTMLLFCSGQGPRQILKALPGRLSFSIADDIAVGVAFIAARHESHVWILSRSDHKALNGNSARSQRSR